MRRSAVVCGLVLAFLPVLARAQAPALKIGVFDAGRLSSETALGKSVTAQLSRMQDGKKTEIQGKGKELQGLQDQLAAQAASLSGERRNALEKEIQRKTMELNHAQDAARSEMQIELNSAQEKFRQKMEAVIADFCREEKFSLVLEKGTLAYVDPALDVTTVLVDRFNRMFPGEAAAAK